MIPLAISFPHWLKPEIIPGLPIRWYGVMYFVAFGVAFIFYRKQVRERRFPMNEDELSGVFFWTIFGLLLGARVFATLVYETSDIYRRSPWLIFWPFRNGRFTGLQGMSYHGGFIGGVLGSFLYSKVKKFSFREVSDMFAASIPLGYTFGRLGNFINGELFGRITASPIGIIFPYGGISRTNKDWGKIAAWAQNAGFAVGDGVLNLPRHPSQLYEALFEGLILWAIIWIVRNKKPFKGFLIGLYGLGYSIFRFAIEYFREPDSELGYRIQLLPNDTPIALAHPLTSLSTGQIFSLGVIVISIIWLVIASRLPDRASIRVYETPGHPRVKTPDERAREAEEKKAEKKSRRKLRRKLGKS
jgi:phosphatidylglycerol:prolipoprotein diacylglycerol transferase